MNDIIFAVCIVVVWECGKKIGWILADLYYNS